MQLSFINIFCFAIISRDSDSYKVIIPLIQLSSLQMKACNLMTWKTGRILKIDGNSSLYATSLSSLSISQGLQKLGANLTHFLVENIPLRKIFKEAISLLIAIEFWGGGGSFSEGARNIICRFIAANISKEKVARRTKCNAF
ncbi:hypothetical protein KP509_06G008000 [Ceratopteris richardii]|uniref:Uncharacterized protein n=1 Tax=Ceratopteris richardii TaxID=49495 RepID=A0A8T2UDC2_CERRI|nr:hypothetical protein KP509_06G008000 [Ceratopteris richardii]